MSCRFLLLHALFACVLFPTNRSLAGSSPNILLILADDMGYGDLGCMGSKAIQTPHIDCLAESGVLFTQAYVTSSVCSPSRAGLITGRDPRRFGYEGNLNASSENYAARPELLGLPVQEHTLADHLSALGYQSALVGKWHLGGTERFHPNRRGFGYFCGMLGGGHDYFPRKGKNKLERNGQPLASFSSPYLTDFFTDEAIRWISSSTRNDETAPWFLYLSYNAPHTPMQATKEDLAHCSNVRDPKRRTYAAMMRALDRGVGRIVQSLHDTGQTENTLIVFLSDNGGATSNASWNGPLSGAKGTLREGGIRVPMIWSWPSKISPGRVDSSVVSSLDLLPTFVTAAQGTLLPLNPSPSYHDRQNEKRARKEYGVYDGVNLLPLLCQNAESTPRRLFWRLQGQAAVLSANQKLIRLSHRPAQIFDVSADMGEQNDLANESQQLHSLFAELAAWEATFPTVPIWDSSPYWYGDSARIHDGWSPRSEPN